MRQFQSPLAVSAWSTISPPIAMAVSSCDYPFRRTSKPFGTDAVTFSSTSLPLAHRASAAGITRELTGPCRAGSRHAEPRLVAGPLEDPERDRPSAAADVEIVHRDRRH